MAFPVRETLRHIKAFEYWYRLSPRLMEPVAKKFGVAVSSISNWSAAFGWQLRARDRDLEVRAKTDEKAIETLAQVNVRHIRDAQLIQFEAKKHLIRAKKGSFKDSVLALKEGILLERLAKGEATEITKLPGQVTLIDIREAIREESKGQKEKKEKENKKEVDGKQNLETDKKPEEIVQIPV